MSRPLRNAQHEAFCREHAGGQSLRAAWVAAGFPEHSRNWWRLARRPKIVARTEQLRQEFNEAAGIHLRFIQEKLLAIASADVTNYFRQNDWGTLSIKKNLAELPPEQRAAIAELTISKGGQVSLKLESKSRALDTLLKTMPGVAVNEMALQFNQIERVIVAAPAVEAAPQAALALDGLHPRLAAILKPKGNSENVNR
jgi:hypothetical protein